MIFMPNMVNTAEKRRTRETAVTISGLTIGMLVTVMTALLVYFFLNFASPSAASVPTKVAMIDERTARVME